MDEHKRPKNDKPFWPNGIEFNKNQKISTRWTVNDSNVNGVLFIHNEEYKVLKRVVM